MPCSVYLCVKFDGSRDICHQHACMLHFAILDGRRPGACIKGYVRRGAKALRNHFNDGADMRFSIRAYRSLSGEEVAA